MVNAMSDPAEQIAANLACIQDRIAAAALRVERSPDAVTLVAVTKYAAWPAVQLLIETGQHTLGESRPQQLTERASLSREQPDTVSLEWHLIGHLQRNKVRSVLPATSLIHSVDSVRLAQRIDEVARESGIRPRVLFEVNTSGETAKDGFEPEELRRAWPELLSCSQLDIRGFMTMAPQSEHSEGARPCFRQLRSLRDELAQRGELELSELSMGMSGDFEIAIEEGATLVRIGSALFAGLE